MCKLMDEVIEAAANDMSLAATIGITALIILSYRSYWRLLLDRKDDPLCSKVYL